jgi:hypothetical protein
VQAYIQFSCFIVGPNERPPVHSADEDFPEGQSDDDDEDALQARLDMIKRSQGVAMVNTPQFIKKTY